MPATLIHIALTFYKFKSLSNIPNLCLDVKYVRMVVGKKNHTRVNDFQDYELCETAGV